MTGHSSAHRVHYSVWYIEPCKYVFNIWPMQQYNKNEQKYLSSLFNAGAVYYRAIL